MFRFHFLRIWIQKTEENRLYNTEAGTASGLEKESLDQEVAQYTTETELASAIGIIIPASRITFETFRVLLKRPCSENILPTVHIMLCFIWSLASVEELLNLVEYDIPWSSICIFLNTLSKTTTVMSDLLGKTLPRLDNSFGPPLPEDFIIRGQLFALGYYPFGWLERVQATIDERSLECPSVDMTRKMRILWLGFSIALVSTMRALRKRLIISSGNVGFSMTRLQKNSNP